ncbi:FAD-dependent oxidoreductase [Pseudodesulfovibrio senegalensis]|uniref:FAD-dependent oxidoreductase n=1 Tax=Pseudodesulfovibrio senegalensis TaxID=1721087 RepID=A0A6N6N2P6_9BACT|nr:FAD-dependent oxidoreductase [Pseudodesulfovibrio senegalensis]KAB1442299.1 FAD-dependent oxidoreductase [Pseudodesulfovibrio senegalensis]
MGRALRYTELMHVHSCDILILGAGLSGLRAAWSITEQNPEISVTLVSANDGPSGSSFANQNNALGMIVPRSGDERECFVNRAMELGAPGFMDEKLARILAEEAEPRLDELKSLGLRFRQNEQGDMKRFPVCGDPSGRAVIFEDLGHAHQQFARQIQDKITHMPATIQGLTPHEGRCVGAWGVDDKGRTVTIAATATILALGGPAPLYPAHSAGPGNPGISLGLLREAGVATANTGFLQFMWFDDGGQFVNVGALPMQATVAGKTGPEPEMRALRSTHCPAFHFHKDNTVDRWLLHGADQQGNVMVRIDGETRAMRLTAHAGNGGAVVDEHGATSLPGLFAVGECATGMHGANRLGGAMVAATQVFGRRAGLAAVRHAKASERPRKKAIQSQMEGAVADNGYSPTPHSEIAQGLQRHALFMAGPGMENFIERLRKLSASPDRLTALQALATLEVTTGMAAAYSASRPRP